MIEVKHLTRRYGSHLAVDDLSFTVEDGKIYGLLGPNGAGKSTTMNIMTGYLAPTSGTVMVDGHDIQEEPAAAKASLGYLPEVPPLYPEMTVEEYLSFAAQLKGVAKADRATQRENAMQRVGLQGMEKRLIRNLSKGYRQRVGLACALLGKPKIIILDEPTVGLDPAQMIEIRTLIRELGKEHTVILSSHILSEVSAVCDHVLIISDGRLAAQGTPEELAGELAGSNTVSLTVQGTEQKVQAALQKVAGVSLAFAPAEQAGEVRFTVTSPESADVRAALSCALVEGGCPVLDMRTETMSLEDVFLQLTAEDAEESAEGYDEASQEQDEPGLAPSDDESEAN